MARMTSQFAPLNPPNKAKISEMDRLEPSLFVTKVYKPMAEADVIDPDLAEQLAQLQQVISSTMQPKQVSAICPLMQEVDQRGFMIGSNTIL